MSTSANIDRRTAFAREAVMTLPRRGMVLLAAVLLLSGSLAAQTTFAPLSAANLTRLRTLAMRAETADTFPADMAALLGLGSEPLSAKQIMSTWRGGQIYLAFLDGPRGDVVMSVKDATRIAVYLTDATRELRAAVLVDASGKRRVSNEQAVAAFRLTLQRWNELAIENAAATP